MPIGVSKKASGSCVRTRLFCGRPHRILRPIRQASLYVKLRRPLQPRCGRLSSLPPVFFLQAISAALTKRRPSTTPSRYMPMVKVAASSGQVSRSPLSLMSPLLRCRPPWQPEGLVSAIQRAQPDEKTPDWPMIDTPPTLIGSRPTMEVACRRMVESAYAIGSHNTNARPARLFD